MQSARKQPREEFVVQQQEPQNQNQIIQERVIAGENDGDLPRRDQAKQSDARTPRQECGEDEHQLQGQRQKCRGRMEAVRQVMR